MNVMGVGEGERGFGEGTDLYNVNLGGVLKVGDPHLDRPRDWVRARWYH